MGMPHRSVEYLLPRSPGPPLDSRSHPNSGAVPAFPPGLAIPPSAGVGSRSLSAPGTTSTLPGRLEQANAEKEAMRQRYEAAQARYQEIVKQEKAEAQRKKNIEIVAKRFENLVRFYKGKDPFEDFSDRAHATHPDMTFDEMYILWEQSFFQRAKDDLDNHRWPAGFQDYCKMFPEEMAGRFSLLSSFSCKC